MEPVFKVMKYDNPFSNTKASHLTDKEVVNQWVDLDANHRNYIGKLRAAIPAILVGGKGCGKTHLMRFYSFPIQQIRHGSDLLSGLKEEGFIGIYGRVENLNPHRFEGKEQNPEVWGRVFPFYFQLWFSEILLRILRDLKSSVPELCSLEASVSKNIASIFEASDGSEYSTFEQAIDHFCDARRSLDNAINNCGITGGLDVSLTVSPGVLLRGIPAIVRHECRSLCDMRFHYMLDEFELFLPDQQRYVHTLLRELGEGISIKIGSRLYGLKTFETLNDGEVNKEGSEYEKIELENRSRARGNDYRRFARQLIQRRLFLGGQLLPSDSDSSGKQLTELFRTPANGRFAKERTRFVNDKKETERIYFSRLRKHLQIYGAPMAVADQIIADLRCDDYPLLEKAGILALYKDWRAPHELGLATSKIKVNREELLDDDKTQNSLGMLLGHFKADLIAQIYRDYKRQQEYSGLDTLIDLSAGLPRSLLVIMKHVFELAEFRGELSSLRHGAGQISKKVQQDAVIKAANWFFEDALIKGRDGIVAQRAIRNLGELFKAIRFSDKPVESSLCTFSVDLLSLSEAARRSVRLAEEYSLLIRPIREHKDRNSTGVLPKFQMSPMLAPIWDLPVSRRGVIQLSSDECEVLFVGEDSESVRKVIDSRVRRMTAPAFDKNQDIINRGLDLFGYE
jgi:hypothetical protein